MIKKATNLVQVQAKPRLERQTTYFCRLCRNYDIKSRKAHLKNYHNAEPDTISKRVTNDIIEILFIQNTA